MHDEDLLEARHARATNFAADLAHIVSAAGQEAHWPCSDARVSRSDDESAGRAVLRTYCRAQLARSLAWAIPGGVLAGIVAAAIAASSGPIVLEPGPAHARVLAQFALPYPA